MNAQRSLVACLEGLDPLLEGLGPLDVGVIAHGSSAVAEELLVAFLQLGIFLAARLLDAVLVVLVVLVLGRVILILRHDLDGPK